MTISGTNFIGTMSVTFNGVATTSFAVASATRVLATVPIGATTGPIAVRTPAGTGTSTTNFIVAPWITSFTPAKGQAGTLVTITGGNFTGATSVTFRGRPASFTVDSSTRITATVPAGARTGRIAVTTAAGTGRSSTRFIVDGPPHQPTDFGDAQGRPGTETGITLAEAPAPTMSALGSAATVVDWASETGALTEPTSATSTATRGPQVIAQMASLGLGSSGPADGMAIRFSLAGSGLKLLTGVTSAPDTFSDEGGGEYRGMHLRIKPAFLAAGRQALTSNTAWRYSFYSPEMNLLAETELRTTIGTPAVLYEYVWFNGHPVAQVDAGVVTHWTFTDHLGTPLIQTTSAGNVYWQAEYEPYGKVFALRTVDQHQPLRLPGQEAEQLNLGPDGVTERSYNIFRWYRNGWGRYTQADPIGLRGATNLFGYALENPLTYFDSRGLKVQRCCRPAQILFGLVDHCWLKTDSYEAGMGNQGGNVPGNRSDCPYTRTQVVSHRGQSDQSGATCTDLPNTDEACVNKFIGVDSNGLGRPTGRFSPWNNCQTWTDSVARECTPLKCPQKTTMDIPPPVSWQLQ